MIHCWLLVHIKLSSLVNGKSLIWYVPPWDQIAPISEEHKQMAMRNRIQIRINLGGSSDYNSYPNIVLWYYILHTTYFRDKTERSQNNWLLGIKARFFYFFWKNRTQMSIWGQTAILYTRAVEGWHLYFSYFSK